MATKNRAQQTVENISAKFQENYFVSNFGYKVFVSSDTWKLSKDTTINLELVKSLTTEEVFASYKKTLTYFAKNLSSDYTKGLQSQFLVYLRATGTRKITIQSILNFKAKLNKRNQWYLGSLRVLLKKWYELGYQGVPDEVYEQLNDWRLSGNVKGEAVLSFDPKKGPFDDIELQGLNDAIAQSFEKGLISRGEFGMNLTLSYLGIRPVQITHIKLKDLIKGQSQGEDLYILRIPRAKQRNVGFREQFKDRAINTYLWRALKAQADFVSSEIKKLNFKIPTEIIAELPLFPDKKLWQMQNFYELERSLKTDQLHVSKQTISYSLKKIVKDSKVMGRDGHLLHVSPVRFRYTTGSRAAREGFGSWVIAELLDHSDTQNADVYVKTHPNFAQKIDKALSKQLAPYAKAFMGKIIEDTNDAINGNELGMQVRNEIGHVGVCGSYGHCGSHPAACYTCIHFQPLLDAPHEKLLEDLIQQREESIALTGDMAVSSSQDRTILAVAQVVQLCLESQLKEELMVDE